MRCILYEVFPQVTEEIKALMTEVCAIWETAALRTGEGIDARFGVQILKIQSIQYAQLLCVVSEFS